MNRLGQNGQKIFLQNPCWQEETVELGLGLDNASDFGTGVTGSNPVGRASKSLIKKGL
jgi:hypothetical protein